MHKVLIADDEANIRNILDFTLNAEGFTVIGARNGAEAFTLALSEQPDIVILDVMMPDTDGIEACRRIKGDKRTSNLPVILLTARSGSDDRRRGREAGADAYITKPFSPTKVVATLREILGANKA
ncbi:MAG: response regulator [bacterium]|nr:response regulator [bacterium]